MYDLYKTIPKNCMEAIFWACVRDWRGGEAVRERWDFRVKPENDSADEWSEQRNPAKPGLPLKIVSLLFLRDCNFFIQKNCMLLRRPPWLGEPL